VTRASQTAAPGWAANEFRKPLCRDRRAVKRSIDSYGSNVDEKVDADGERNDERCGIQAEMDLAKGAVVLSIAPTLLAERSSAHPGERHRTVEVGRSGGSTKLDDG